MSVFLKSMSFATIANAAIRIRTNTNKKMRIAPTTAAIIAIAFIFCSFLNPDARRRSP